MKTLDKRNEIYGMDIRVSASLASRHEIMPADTLSAEGTGVSVQELINLVCELLDGVSDHDVADMVGADMADRVIEIRKQMRPLWTLSDGTKVIG